MPRDVREDLADYAHQAWSGWMLYLFGKSVMNSDGSVTIPKDLVERWTRQLNASYVALPENEKVGDRQEADRMLAILGPVVAMREALEKIRRICCVRGEDGACDCDKCPGCIAAGSLK